MKKYEMLLQDFINSDFWKNKIDTFWSRYYHIGRVYDKISKEKIGTYTSVPYDNFYNSSHLDTVFKYFERVSGKNLWVSSDWHRMMLFFYDNCSNPDKLWELDGIDVIEYFLENCENDLNKFFYIFAVANGLSDEQIMCIASRKQDKNRALNYFICNREAKNFCFSTYDTYKTEATINTCDGKIISAKLENIDLGDDKRYEFNVALAKERETDYIVQQFTYSRGGIVTNLKTGEDYLIKRGNDNE